MGLSEAVRALETPATTLLHDGVGDGGVVEESETPNTSNISDDNSVGLRDGEPQAGGGDGGGGAAAASASSCCATTVGAASAIAHVNVETLPDVPGVPRVSCKVRTS